MAVVEVASEPELSTAFPQGAPVVHLIRSPAVLQDKEAAHLTPDECTNMPQGATLEVSSVLLILKVVIWDHQFCNNSCNSAMRCPCSALFRMYPVTTVRDISAYCCLISIVTV